MKRKKWKFGFNRYYMFILTPLFAVELFSGMYDVTMDAIWHGVWFSYKRNWDAGPMCSPFKKTDRTLSFMVPAR